MVGSEEKAASLSILAIQAPTVHARRRIVCPPIGAGIGGRCGQSGHNPLCESLLPEIWQWTDCALISTFPATRIASCLLRLHSIPLWKIVAQ